MKILIKQAWSQFRSEVPSIVKKVQLILGMAAASLGSAAAINWTGKLEVVGTICGYLATGCLGLGIGIQFIQNATMVIETKSEVSVTATETQTITSTDKKVS